MIEVTLPPLREHKVDIPALAEHFLAKFNDDRPAVTGFSTDTLALLTEHDWPGNVRELENAVLRAIVVAASEVIEVKDLPLPVRESIAGGLCAGITARAIALRRETNRIGAKLDLLLHGHDAPGPGETLAHWLGLAESKRVHHNSKRRVPRSKTWQYLAQLYIDEFKNSTIAREINELDAVRRFERIRNLDFCQDRFPPDIKAEEWDEFFDGLMRDRPTSGGGKTTSLVLGAARFLIAGHEATSVVARQHFRRFEEPARK